MARASLEFDLSTETGKYDFDVVHNAMYYRQAFSSLLEYLDQQARVNATLTPAMIFSELEKIAAKSTKLEHLRMLMQRQAARPTLTH